MLITFSGLDGSGKSTLIAWLKTELERRNRVVTVLHGTNDIGIYASVRALRDRVRSLMGHRNGTRSDQPRMAGELPQRPGEGPMLRRLRAHAWRWRDAILWNKPIRRALYPVDLLIFFAVRFYVETLRHRVLITDRYFYDTLVDVADDGRWFWVRLLERLTPTPDLPVFLDITPEQSFARKGEYTVAYLARRRAAYRAVSPLVPAALVLRNDNLAAAQGRLTQALRWSLAL